MLLITLLEIGIEGDMAVLGDDPITTNEGYNDCCGIFGITCQKYNSSCAVSVLC